MWLYNLRVFQYQLFVLNPVNIVNIYNLLDIVIINNLHKYIYILIPLKLFFRPLKFCSHIDNYVKCDLNEQSTGPKNWLVNALQDSRFLLNNNNQ